MVEPFDENAAAVALVTRSGSRAVARAVSEITEQCKDGQAVAAYLCNGGRGGRPTKAEDCPLARAIKAMSGVDTVIVGPAFIMAYVGWVCVYDRRIPPQFIEFMQVFDAGGYSQVRCVTEPGVSA